MLDGTRAGRIEVIAGVMFSGKSEELIRRVRRAVIAKKHVQVFKSHLDVLLGDDRAPHPSNQLLRSEGTRLNSSHPSISYAVFCLKKKNDQHPAVAGRFFRAVGILFGGAEWGNTFGVGQSRLQARTAIDFFEVAFLVCLAGPVLGMV